MNAPSLGRRTIAIVVATVLFLASGTLAWAAAADYQEFDLAPAGTTVAGRDISGLTREQARELIQTAIVAPVQQPVTVYCMGQPYTFSAGDVVSVNVDEMLDRAFASRVQSTIDERLMDEVSTPSAPADIAPVYTVDNARVAAWVADVARRVDRAYADASVALVGGRPQFTRASVGYRTDQAAAIQSISSALLNSQRTANLPVAVQQSYTQSLLLTDFCRGSLEGRDEVHDRQCEGQNGRVDLAKHPHYVKFALL